MSGRHKYGARATVLDGMRFDSAREARRYGELCLLAKAGLVADLRCHPMFPIDVVKLYRLGPPYPAPVADLLTLVGVYRADFQYVDTETGEVVTEDVKSGPTRTTAYRLRKRLVEAIHGVTIREV